MLLLARLIRAVASIVALIIVVGIVLVLLKANPTNVIVSDIHDAAQWLVGPFHNLFHIKKPRVNIAVNWGIAAVVYLVVGHFLASVLARSAGVGFRRRAVA
jgi:hypothetical protein